MAMEEKGRGIPTFFFSERSFHMRARSRVSSLSDSSGRSSCSCFRFSSEKMNMAEMGRLGFSELACGRDTGPWVGASQQRDLPHTGSLQPQEKRGERTKE